MFKAANKDASPSASISATVTASHLSSKAGKLRVTPEGGLSFVGDGGSTGESGIGGESTGKSSATITKQGGKQKFFASRTSDGKWNLLMAPTSDPSRLFLVQPAPGHKFQVSGGGVRMESVSTASSQGNRKEETPSSSASNGCVDEHTFEGGNSPEVGGELAPGTSKSAAISPGLEVSTITSSSLACPDTATSGVTASVSASTASTASNDSVKTVSSQEHKKPSFFKSRTSREREALKASVGKKVLAVNRRGSKSTSPAAGDQNSKRGKKCSKVLKSPKPHGKTSKLSSSLQESMSEIFSLMSVSPEAASTVATTIQSPTPVSVTVTTSSVSCANIVNTVASSYSLSSSVPTTATSSTSDIQTKSLSELETSDTRPASLLPHMSPSSSPSPQTMNISPPTSPLRDAPSPTQLLSSVVTTQVFLTPTSPQLLSSLESASSQPVGLCSQSRTNPESDDVCDNIDSSVLDTKVNSSTDSTTKVSDCSTKTTTSDSAPVQSSSGKNLSEGNIEKENENSVSVMDNNGEHASDYLESSLSPAGMPEQSSAVQDLHHIISDPRQTDDPVDEFDLSAYKPRIDNYENRKKTKVSDEEDDIPLSSLQLSGIEAKESDEADALVSATEMLNVASQQPRRNSRRSTAGYTSQTSESLNLQYGNSGKKDPKISVSEKSFKRKLKERKSTKRGKATEKLLGSASDTDDYEPTKSPKEKETRVLSKRQSRKGSSSSDFSLDLMDTEKFRGRNSPSEKSPEKSDAHISINSNSDTDIEQTEPHAEKSAKGNNLSVCSEPDSHLPMNQDKRLEGDLSEDYSERDKLLCVESEVIEKEDNEHVLETSLSQRRSARAGASVNKSQPNVGALNSELALSGKQPKPNKRKKRKSELEVLIADQEVLADVGVEEDISVMDTPPLGDVVVEKKHETNTSPQEQEVSEHVETASETTEHDSIFREEKKQKKKKKKKKKKLKILINLAEAKVKNNVKQSEQSASSVSVLNSTQEELIPPPETDLQQPEGAIEECFVHASGNDTEDSSTLTSTSDSVASKTKQKKKKLKIIFGGGQETSTREIPSKVTLDCTSKTDSDFVPTDPAENVADAEPSNRDHATSVEASDKAPAVNTDGEESNNEGTVETTNIPQPNKERDASATSVESPVDNAVESTNDLQPEKSLTPQPQNKDDAVEPSSVQESNKDQAEHPLVSNPVVESTSQQLPKKQRKKRLTELEKIIQDQEALARAEELRLAGENSEKTDEDSPQSENEPEKENGLEISKASKVDKSAVVPEIDLETTDTEAVVQVPPPKTKKSEKTKKRKKKKQKESPASAEIEVPSQSTEDITDVANPSWNLEDSQSTDTYIVSSESGESNSDNEDSEAKENRAMAKYLKSRSFTQNQLAETFGIPFVVLERLSDKDIFFMSRRFRNARVSSRTKCSLHCRNRTLGYLCELKLIECNFRSGLKRASEASSLDGMPPKKKGRQKKSSEEKAERKKRKKKTNKEVDASGDNGVAVTSGDKGGTGGDKSNTSGGAPPQIIVSNKPPSLPTLTPAPRSLLNPVTSFSGFSSTSTGGRIVRVAPPLAPAKPSYLMARTAAPTPRFISISSIGSTISSSSLPQIISLPPLVASTTGTSRIIIPPIMATTSAAATTTTTTTTSSASRSLRDTMRASLTQAISNSLHKANFVPVTTAVPSVTTASLLNSALLSALSAGPSVPQGPVMVQAAVSTGALTSTTPSVGGLTKQFFVVQMGDKRVLVPATALTTTATTATTPAALTISTASTAQSSQSIVTAGIPRSVTTVAGGTPTISTVVMEPVGQPKPASVGTRPPPPLVPGSVARIVLSNRRPPVPSSSSSPRTGPTASTLLFSSRGAQRNQAWVGPRPTQASTGPRAAHTGVPRAAAVAGQRTGTEKRILVSPASQPQGIRVVISGPGSITSGSRFTVASSRGGGVFVASRPSTSLIKLPMGPSRPGKRVMTEEERLRKRARLEKKYPLPPGVVIKTEATTFGYGDEGKTVQAGNATPARVLVSSVQGGRTPVNLNQPIPVLSAGRGSPIIIRQASPGAASGGRSSSSLLGPLIIRVPNPTTSSSSATTTARVTVSSSNMTTSLLPSAARLTTTVTNAAGHVFSLLSGTSAGLATTTSSTSLRTSAVSTTLTASTGVPTSTTTQSSSSRVGMSAPSTVSATTVVSSSTSGGGARNVVGQEEDDDDVYIVDSPQPRLEPFQQGGDATQPLTEASSSASSLAAVSLPADPGVIRSSSSSAVVTPVSVSASNQAATVSSTITSSSAAATSVSSSFSPVIVTLTPSASDPFSATSVSSGVVTTSPSSTNTSRFTPPPSVTTSVCPTSTSPSVPAGAATSTVTVDACTSDSLTNTSAPLSSSTATSLLRGTPSPSFSSPSSPVPSIAITSSRMASLGAMLARQATESGSLPSIDASSLQSERLRRLKEALAKQMVNVSDERRQRVLQALSRQMPGGSGGDRDRDDVHTGEERVGESTSSLNSVQNSAQQSPAQVAVGLDQQKQPATDSEVVVVLDEPDERDKNATNRQSDETAQVDRQSEGSRGDKLDHSTDSSVVNVAEEPDQGAENDVVILEPNTESTLSKDSISVDGRNCGSDQSATGGTESRSSTSHVEKRTEEHSAVDILDDEGMSGGGDTNKSNEETETSNTSHDRLEETAVERGKNLSSETDRTDYNMETSNREVDDPATGDNENRHSTGCDSETFDPVATSDGDPKDKTVSDACDSSVATTTKAGGGEECVEIINSDEEQS